MIGAICWLNVTMALCTARGAARSKAGRIRTSLLSQKQHGMQDDSLRKNESRARDEPGAAPLLNHTAAQAVFPVIEDHRLSGSNSLVRLGQRDFPSTVLDRAELAPGEARAVPYLGLQFEPLRLAPDPIHRTYVKLSPRVIEKSVGVRHVNAVGGHILLNDIPRTARQTDAFALADGVKPETAMSSEGSSRLQLHNFTRAFAEVMTHELRILDFAEKADPLAVFAVAIGQIVLMRQPSHAVLAQVADGEPKPAKLFLVERAEEIRLVLDRVRRTFEPTDTAALLDLRVMAAHDFVETSVDLLAEQSELDALVAPDIGTWSASGAKFLHRSRDNAFLVFGLE